MAHERRDQGDRPDRGDELLRTFSREGWRGGALRAQLADRFPDHPAEDIEDAVQEACAAFLAEAPGITEPRAAYAWIRTAAHRSLIHELRRLRRAVPADPGEAPIGEAPSERPGPGEELIALEDETDLEVLVREVASSLSPTRRGVLALWATGRSRTDIAAELGVGDRVVKRALEEIMREARSTLAGRAGHGCEEGGSIVLRLLCGLSSADEAVRARAHLGRCERCTSFAESLEDWREKAGAVLGPIAIEAAHPGLVTRTVGRVGDAVSSVRRHVLGGATQVRQQAVAAGYARPPDPTPLAGVRPGAVVAVVAGCLAIGGGATYCARQGVDPLGAATNLIAGTHEGAKEEPPPPSREPQTPVRPVEAPVAATPVYEPTQEAPMTEATPAHEGQDVAAEQAPQESETQPEPAPTPEPEPEPVTPPAEQSFEPASPDYPATESSASTSLSSPSTSSTESATTTSPAAKPAAVPAHEAPQFGGP